MKKSCHCPLVTMKVHDLGFCLFCFVSYLHDVIKWKHFPRYWPFARGIHRSPVNSTHKGQWRGALVFSLICAWINAWVNNRDTGDLRRHRAHHDVTLMVSGPSPTYMDACVAADAAPLGFADWSSISATDCLGKRHQMTNSVTFCGKGCHGILRACRRGQPVMLLYIRALLNIRNSKCYFGSPDEQVR